MRSRKAQRMGTLRNGRASRDLPLFARAAFVHAFLVIAAGAWRPQLDGLFEPNMRLALIRYAVRLPTSLSELTPRSGASSRA
jgi:hypothetical protein